MKKSVYYSDLSCVCRYVGRHAAAAAATGNKAMHIMEVGQFMRQALEMWSPMLAIITVS